MDPYLIAKIAQIASVLEVSGHPKPGNVHRTQDFEDMVFEDFLISGIVIGDLMNEAALKASKFKGRENKLNEPNILNKIELGELIKEAVVETNKWVENNTNLGIVMLLTPLSAAAGLSNSFMELRDNVDAIMRATTPEDAVNLYDAINIADAGGMGERDELDVGSDKARDELLEKSINMFQVLEISSSWDALAYELTHRMPLSFEIGYPEFKRLKSIYGINQASVQTFLTILSREPDTLISRKYGSAAAEKVRQGARVILDKGGILTRDGKSLVEEFDQELMVKNCNPGTTADLTASSLMIALLDEHWV